MKTRQLKQKWRECIHLKDALTGLENRIMTLEIMKKDILTTRQQMLEDGIKFYKSHNEVLRNESISYLEIKAIKLIQLNDMVQRTKLYNEIKIFQLETEGEIIKLQTKCIKLIQVQHENLQNIRNIYKDISFSIRRRQGIQLDEISEQLKLMRISSIAPQNQLISYSSNHGKSCFAIEP